VSELGEEDRKILTLAQSARTRTGGAEGAAVRDDIGRTYVAATVDLRSLKLSALQAAVAAAVSSGSTHFEAVAVVGQTGPSSSDLALLTEIGSPVLLAADPSGRLRE